MGEMKSCLKKCFICFDVILGLMGLIVLMLFVVIHVQHEGTEKKIPPINNGSEIIQFDLPVILAGYPRRASYEFQNQGSRTGGLALSYAFTSVVILLSILGVYSTCTEKKWALITFFTLAILSCIGLLVIGVQFTRISWMVSSNWENYTVTNWRLSKSSENDKEIAELLQSQLQCCGYVDGYTDWGSDIPDSCLCLTDLPAECVTVEKSPKNPVQPGSVSDGDIGKLVYKQTCYAPVQKIIWAAFSIFLVIIFGPFALMLLLAVLCMVILYQMRTRRPASEPVVFTR